MKEPKRYSCGNGEGMFDNEKGYWVSYKEHLEIVNKLKEAITFTQCCTELRDEYLQTELDKYKNIKVERAKGKSDT